jgi:predicted Rossmann-fold nucleotide-binding protein
MKHETLCIGIIGPTNIHLTSQTAGLDPAACERTAKAAGESLAQRGYDVVLVPDRGVALLAAQAYRAAGGRRLIGIIPHGGTSEQTATSRCEDHRHLCHETVEDLTWTGQHERICQLSDVLLCVGISCGTIAEIAWTKWVGNTPVVVIQPLVSGIPPEVQAETDLHWVKTLEGFYRFLTEMEERR